MPAAHETLEERDDEVSTRVSRRLGVQHDDAPPVRLLGPFQTGHFDQPLFEVADQAADKHPTGFATQFNFAMRIDPQDRVSVDAGIVKLFQVDLTFIHDVEQRLASQFDELRFHEGA
jgi:hypothetical protein